MKHWHVKALSQLAQVSVRTLHYYDKIGLLTPSLRQDNDYRLYSEKDLLKLQQIIALKFFGFELNQIKKILDKKQDVLELFAMQAKFLQEKAETLLEAKSILTGVMQKANQDKSISWQQVIELIEVYKMSKQLEDVWVKEIFTPDELKQYANFEAEMKQHHEKADFSKRWDELVTLFKKNLHQNPNSSIGVELGEKLMNWVNGVYGKKYAHLRTKKFEKGFGEGKGLDQHGLTPELVEWMEKAMDCYWRHRVYQLLSTIQDSSQDVLRRQWSELMDEMYGEEEERKIELAQKAISDEHISEDAKSWLKSEYGL